MFWLINEIKLIVLSCNTLRYRRLYMRVSAYRKPFLASTVHDKPFLLYDFIVPDLVPKIFASAQVEVLKNT